VAMFIRNLIILAIFSPRAVITAAGPLLAMTVAALFFAHRASAEGDGTSGEIHLESPVSLKRVLVFATLFVLIQTVSTLAERYLGKLGFLGVSVMGGLVSSASTSAAAANMVGHGRMQPSLAGEGVVLASVASALINLPILYRTARNPDLSRRLATLTLVLSAIGVVVLALQECYWSFGKSFFH
jgi:uncharacterized membrane protein (DUF4010 family)